ncbi:polyprenol phosphomannose-dependent alpha 1,6 mannosyltransferase MptB [Phytohabitans sp. ZYX-F-186]|uniref:Polyprenol phosphomannose-dependent alpha 1,6 mannosyltransferase MptB n=1 Tax=Phytohabitans maris TaxID=3071409 RepID=A0ABU0ZLN8_9ACTN|nr:polyprenol phosphomannose-dependent alpha 1,6 mannosyltransferase MptB [Phytohabitans sp. ZYX-F-186]MDQ7907964.1 polyprenol phosphomannose-dependent alpha 1,6 mannosyltransferase MptB [Phytohabitans sp. ZYX-F-186]
MLTNCRALGLGGSVLLAAGGLAAGALPAQVPFGLAILRRHPGWGVVIAYAGLVLLIAAWWRLGHLVRDGARDEPTPRQLMTTLAIWSAPLLLAPPLFSRDVYSYLAQGTMVGAGLDVYEYGPAYYGGPVAAEVPAIWQHTPTPYGPFFLLVATGVAAAAGAHLAAGVLGMRLVAVLGVVLLTAALPGLARRCGVDPAAALWLGALNPLVLAHLIAGAHNDAIMVGLLVAGLAAAAARHPAAGAVLVALAALVKAPAAVALVFVAAIWSEQATGRWRRVRTMLYAAAVATATTVVVTAVAGTGYGWVRALDTPVSTGNWSPMSVLGRLTGAILGTAHAVPMWRWIGLAAAVVVSAVLWLRRTDLGPVYALGLGLGAIVLFGPAMRPWYLLWGLVPLAAAAPDGRVRRVAAVACAALAVVVLPNGFAFGAEQVVQAVAGCVLAAGLAAALLARGQAPVVAR